MEAINNINGTANPNSHIAELIGRRLKDTISEPECDELNQWLAASGENQAFFERFNDDQYVCSELEKHYRFDAQAGWEKLTVQANIPWRRTKPVATLNTITNYREAFFLLIIPILFN